MNTTCLQIMKSPYSRVMLLMGTLIWGSCSQSHQLGMDPNPQHLLNMKLANPDQELSATQSISLINHCAQLGERNTVPTASREVVMVMGNTGTGKSTTINALMGCQMKLVKPRELNLPGTKKIVIVDPASPLNEIMPIGHGHGSKTFLPQIASDPNHTHRAYCDCPGFSDNRGPEINIANAINIKQVLQRSAGITAVFLQDYFGLRAGRGDNLSAMKTMCHQIFGGIDNLEAHQNSVLLGITRAPLYEDDEPLTHDAVRSLLKASPERTIKILADRMFLFDPLDRGSDNPDFWSIERCRNEKARLKSK